MADLLAQFDIVERAELARNRIGDRDDAVLGGGGDGARGSLNPFDDQELQSPVAAVQVIVCDDLPCTSTIASVFSSLISRILPALFFDPSHFRIECTPSSWYRTILYSAGVSCQLPLGQGSLTSPSPTTMPPWS